MGTTPSPFDADATFCLGCGYVLRQLPANRCPECARGFDPADPRTVGHGRPLRSWQRRLLRRLGWPAIMLAMLGTMGLAFLSYRPHLRLEPWSIWRDELRWPMDVPRPFTTPDRVFYAAAGLWVAFFVSFTFRILGRLAVPRVARRANQLTPASRHRRRAIWLAMTLSGFLLVFGWEQRVGQRWMARTPSQKPAPLAWGDIGRDGSGQPLFHFSAEQSNLILADLITDLPTARGRLLALRELFMTWDFDGRV
jgi:hypothetical protein